LFSHAAFEMPATACTGIRKTSSKPA
jgi:hypothetical protein